MNTLLDIVKEQGIVSIVDGYKNEMEDIKIFFSGFERNEKMSWEYISLRSPLSINFVEK